MKVAFPKDDESLVEFLSRFKSKKFEATLYPRCSAIFERNLQVEVVKFAKRKGNSRDSDRPQFVSDSRRQ